MSIKMNCLGWHWNAKTYKYEKSRTDHDGKPAGSIPKWLNDIAVSVLIASGYMKEEEVSYFDICIMNSYSPETGKLGMHCDNSETKESIASGYPVLSISLGAEGRFLVGGLDKKERDPEEIRLQSGDAYIFGRSLRLVYHGVKGILPGTAPAELGMKGRLNLTFRKY